MAQNTISDELNRLIQAKADIKSALEEKGLTIGDSSTLDEFPGLILEMEVGGGSSVDTSTIIDLIEGDVSGNFVIPNGTTKIKAYLFDNCHNITNVTIPNSVTSIGVGAFEYCDNNNFTQLNIPNNVNYIGMLAFLGTKITFFNIPEGVTSLESFTFSNGRATLIKLPSTITNIKNNAYQQTFAETILLAKNVPTLGSNGLNNAATTYKIYVPGDSVDSYKNAGGNWNNVSTRITPLAAIDYDDTTYTVTASGRDNVELYVDASLCDSSVYTFTPANSDASHNIMVKSVDPSLGVLDEVSLEILIEASTPKLGAPTIDIGQDRTEYFGVITSTDVNADTIYYKINDGDWETVTGNTANIANGGIILGDIVYAYAVDSTGTYANSDTVSATVGE